MTDNWPTYCNLIEGWDTDKCCGTCHDDAYEYGIEPCSIEYKGRTLFVCCACWEWFREETMIMSNNTRTTMVLNEETNSWENILPQDIKHNMIVRMFEPDGTPVLYHGEMSEFRVSGNAFQQYIDDEKVWTFCISIEE